MYFQLTSDRFYDFGITEPEEIPLELDFMNGSIISMPIENKLIFTTNASAEDQPPDFWDGSIPVMSRRFLEIIESSGVDNIQKFSIVVKSEIDGTLWDNYYAVNIIGVIECADFSRSNYNEIFPGSYSFDELAIDSKKTRGILLFRLQEDPSIILIHKNVGKHIAKLDPEDTLVGWDAIEVIQ